MDNAISELANAWEQTQQSDTIDAYAGYLAKQGLAGDRTDHEEDLELYLELGDRRDIARTRIFELALDTVQGTCPFKSVYVDLRQNLTNASGRPNLQSTYENAFELMGVAFVHDPSQADATLVFELNGRGISQGYAAWTPNAGVYNATTGGEVEGAIWIEQHPETKVSFAGYAEPRNMLNVGHLSDTPDPDRDYGDKPDGVSDGIEHALSAADFHTRVAELIYDACSPQAGIFVKFGKDEPSLSTETPNTVLLDKISTDFDAVRPMLIAAALGTPITQYNYPSSSQAFTWLLDHSTADRDRMWRAKRGLCEPPPWQIVVLIDGETYEDWEVRRCEAAKNE